MLAGGAQRPRKALRAMDQLFLTSLKGTNRPSPMNQCPRPHGMRPRQASVPSSSNICFGLDPPERQIAERPLLATILAIRRSAAAFACAAGSSVTITFELGPEPSRPLSFPLSPASSVARQQFIGLLGALSTGLVALQSLGACLLPGVEERLH